MKVRGKREKNNLFIILMVLAFLLSSQPSIRFVYAQDDTSSSSSTASTTLISSDAPKQDIQTQVNSDISANNSATNTPPVDTGSAISGSPTTSLEISQANTQNSVLTSTSTLSGNPVPENSSSSSSTAITLPIMAENSSSTPSGDSTSSIAGIDSGSAAATADLVNSANSNSVNSTGTVSILNSNGDLTGDIIVGVLEQSTSSSSTDSGVENSTSSTSTDLCANGCNSDSGNIQVDATNTADIANDVSVSAQTGNNLINDAQGTSTIKTGDAYAAANIINFANTNIINSNYTFLISNTFGNWKGDLLFPGKDFFTKLFPSPSSVNSQICSQQYINSTSSANVSNNVAVNADSGQNIVDGNNGFISTGAAKSIANTLNFINSNILNSNYVFILIKVAGSWQGQIFSLPPGLSIIHTPDGIVISADASADCNGGTVNSLNVNNDSTITNNVAVDAGTGNNQISATSSDSSNNIVSGDAFAVSNILNVANSSIISSNWLSALVNVFGDWQGNIAFGKPDLWLGERAEVSRNPLLPGSTITLNIDLINQGNADATNLDVESVFDNPGFIQITDPGSGQATDNGIKWSINSLAAGATTTLSFKAVVNNNLPIGLHTLSISSDVKSFEDDANINDNSDSVVLKVVGPGDDSIGGGVYFPPLLITKTANVAGPVHPGDTVKYTIKVKNNGIYPITKANVSDQMDDPFQNIITNNSWDLGQVAAGEEVLINYDVNFATSAPVGTYTSYASLKAFNNEGFPLPEVGVSYTLVMSAAPENSSEDSGGGAVVSLSTSTNGLSGQGSANISENAILDTSNIASDTINVPTGSAMLARSLPLLTLNIPPIEETFAGNSAADPGNSLSSSSVEDNSRNYLLANLLNSVSLHSNSIFAIFLLALLALSMFLRRD